MTRTDILTALGITDPTHEQDAAIDALLATLTPPMDEPGWPGAAAECRAAASKLRELAQRATPGPWRLGSDRWGGLVADRKHPDRMVGGGWEWDDAYGGCLVAESLMRPDREYFAAMHPLVGAALADLLDEVAGHAESNDEYDGFPPESVITGYTPAVTIARLINGNAS